MNSNELACVLSYSLFSSRFWFTNRTYFMLLSTNGISEKFY